VLAVALAVLRRRPAILWTVPVVLVADGIAGLLKVAVGRQRPHLDPLVGVPGSAAFPSGHTTTAFAGAAMLTAFAIRGAPLFYLLASAIGFSRIYVGVHWPLDVLAGAALGTLVALTSLRLLARFPPRPPGGRPRARSRSRSRGRPPAAGSPGS
jgi:undecaprenyl-diphosphatase